MCLNSCGKGDKYTTHRIHGTRIFAYIYHKNQLNVTKYTSPMDPMAYIGSYGIYASYG